MHASVEICIKSAKMQEKHCILSPNRLQYKTYNENNALSGAYLCTVVRAAHVRNEGWE